MEEGLFLAAAALFWALKPKELFWGEYSASIIHSLIPFGDESLNRTEFERTRLPQITGSVPRRKQGRDGRYEEGCVWRR